ncbi:MAG: ABC transporter substrate-binding protein [Synergistaceae bacterium]|nr:ABC transporter substrate-binding protein [Synergistaceae bacterium]
MNFVKKGILIMMSVLFVSGWRPSVPAAEELSGFLTVVDDAGTEVSFDGPARRIVSLYAGHTENLIALGAKSLLVAASNGDDPAILGSLPRVGMKPGVEMIISLGPDLVLTRTMNIRVQEALYSKLRSLGVKVLAIDPPTWEEFPAYIGLLSKLVGDEDPERKSGEASSLIAGRDASGQRPGAVLITVGRSMATCAPGSWAERIMERAGFYNAARDVVPISRGSVIAALGAERLLALNGKVDAVLLQRGAMNALSAADFMRDPRFSDMKAVRNGNVFDVDEADISRPSLLRLKMGVIDSLGELAAVGR